MIELTVSAKRTGKEDSTIAVTLRAVRAGDRVAIVVPVNVETAEIKQRFPKELLPYIVGAKP